MNYIDFVLNFGFDIDKCHKNTEKTFSQIKKNEKREKEKEKTKNVRTPTFASAFGPP